MMLSVESAFIIFGGILLIGYFGEILAKRFSVPSALLLLLLGYLLKLSGYVEKSSLIGIQELFGTLALIILLFDGGLSLNLNSVIFKSGRVIVMAILITISSVIFSAFFFEYVLGVDPLIGAIFGALAGGIGSTTTISIIKGLQLQKGIAEFLTLESSITDIFSIILTLVFTQALLSGALDVQTIGQGIVAKFSGGLFIGIIAGILSIIVLTRVERGYNYMVTFAIMLILFAFVEFLGGSGAIAVLVFGLIFGNENTVRKIIRIDGTEKKAISMEFQSEVSFFVRTFFFVFLGIIVTLGSMTNFLIAFALILSLYVLRYVSVIISTVNSYLAESKRIITAINPRGLATAVLATYPVLAVNNLLEKEPNGYLLSIQSQLSNFPEIAFYVIILSIVFTTVLVPIVMRENNRKIKSKEII